MKEVGNMGVINTLDWLEKDFRNPIKICEKLVPYFENQPAIEIYKQLQEFGMYKPSRQTWDTIEIMKVEEAGNLVQRFFDHYKKKWGGPDIPIFLFPLNQSRGFFIRQDKGKSGVTFSDKLFLFLSNMDDHKELEALFVHEYHHACRLNRLKGKMDNYTLLDSIIIEGLAEFSVLKNCGEKYLAHWCTMYTEKEIEKFWDLYLKDNINRRKKEKIHDILLYGHGRIPKLLGYAAGFSLVQRYYKQNDFSTKRSFSIPASKFIK
jgi:uncharacterized protein YjaZ